MKVFLAPIDCSGENRATVAQMDKALDRGKLKELLALGEKLKAASVLEHAVVLTEEEWRSLLAAIRRDIPSFPADYLLLPETVREIAGGLPDAPDRVKELLQNALSAGRGVFEWPFDED